MTTWNLPVRKYFVIHEKVDGEEEARSDWVDHIEAHGWTMVGSKSDIQIHKVPEGWAVVGRLIETDNTLPFSIAHDSTVITLP